MRKIIKIGGCVLKLQPVKLGTFFETQCICGREAAVNGFRSFSAETYTVFPYLFRFISKGLVIAQDK